MLRFFRFIRTLLIIAAMVLGVAVLARAFVPATASTPAPFIQISPPQSAPSGQRGAGGATVPSGSAGIIYGAGGPDGTCTGTSGTITKMLQMDFGWTSAFLNPKWAKDTTDQLCNDHWFWTTTQMLPAKTVFTTLKWTDSHGQPLDLLIAPFSNQPISVRPIALIDPVTAQQQQQLQQNRLDPPTGPCDWTFRLLWGQPHIDVCAPLRLLLQAGAWAVGSLYSATAKQIDFLWQTPTAPFQQDDVAHLLTAWDTSWNLVLTSITAVVAYTALRYMLGSVLSWMSYANLVELIPRLVFALIAAFFSKQFFLMAIQINNAIALKFSTDTLNTVMGTHTTGIINSSVQILYGIMAFLLILEEVLRIAVIYVLFAFSPVLFFLMALRETQHWAKGAVTAAILFIFLQAMQAMVIQVGGQLLQVVLHPAPETALPPGQQPEPTNPADLSFLSLLVSIAILFLALNLFFMITRLALGRAGDGLALTPFVAASLAVRAITSTYRSAMGVTGSALQSARAFLAPSALPPPPLPPAGQGIGGTAPGGSGGSAPPPQGTGGPTPPAQGSGTATPTPGASPAGGAGVGTATPTSAAASSSGIAPDVAAWNHAYGGWQKAPPTISPAYQRLLHVALKNPTVFPPGWALPGPKAMPVLANRKKTP